MPINQVYNIRKTCFRKTTHRTKTLIVRNGFTLKTIASLQCYMTTDNNPAGYKNKAYQCKCDKLSNKKNQITWWHSIIKISDILWTKLMILTGIFRITVIVWTQPISVKIVQKINYISINFAIEFLMSIVRKLNQKDTVFYFFVFSCVYAFCLLIFVNMVVFWLFVFQWECMNF